MGPAGSSTSIHNKGPVPSSIEPLRQPRNSSQAKHVPRGQRGLGRGSIAVSCSAIFILLRTLHRCHLVNSLIHFPFPLGLGLRLLRQHRLNQHTRRAPIHRTRRVPRISPFHRIERIVLGRGIIPYYRLIFRHSHGSTDCGSAHKPVLASLASLSSPSSTVSISAYLLTSLTRCQDRMSAARQLVPLTGHDHTLSCL